MTVLDERTLEALAESLGSPQIARVLAEKYRAMLAPRVERLTAALAEQDVDTALDAVKSLRVSSIMVGALELAELAGLIETAVQRCDLSAAREHVPALPEARRRADDALSTYLTR